MFAILKPWFLGCHSGFAFLYFLQDPSLGVSQKQRKQEKQSENKLSIFHFHFQKYGMWIIAGIPNPWA
jgi:hypothetical protein